MAKGPTRRAAKARSKDDDRTFVAQNRRARHDYEILETVEAGLELLGSEVKSLRQGKAQIRDAYARVEDGEMWLMGMHVPPWLFATGFGAHDPERRRRLLLHKRQIVEFGNRVAQAPDPGWHYVLVSLADDAPVVRSYRIVDGNITEEPVVLVR